MKNRFIISTLAGLLAITMSLGISPMQASAAGNELKNPISITAMNKWIIESTINYQDYTNLGVMTSFELTGKRPTRSDDACGKQKIDTSYTMDANGLVTTADAVTFTFPGNHSSYSKHHYAYDEHNMMIADVCEKYGDADAPESTLATVYQYSYNKDGKIINAVRTDQTESNQTFSESEKIQYDSLGRVSRIDHSSNGTMKFTYKNGFLIKITQPSTDPSFGTVITSFTYDAAGRCIKVVATNHQSAADYAYNFEYYDDGTICTEINGYEPGDPFDYIAYGYDRRY